MPNGVKGANQNKVSVEEEAEEVDFTPLVEEDGEDENGFGGFDDDEDEKYMEKARKNAARRRGIDPKSLKGKVGGAGKKENSTEEKQKKEQKQKRKQKTQAGRE